jgi:hypothetical protein
MARKDADASLVKFALSVKANKVVSELVSRRKAA